MVGRDVQTQYFDFLTCHRMQGVDFLKFFTFARDFGFHDYSFVINGLSTVLLSACFLIPLDFSQISRRRLPADADKTTIGQANK